MKRKFGLAVAISSLIAFAAVTGAQAELTTIYGPVHVIKTKHHHGEKETKLSFTAPVPGNGVVIIRNGGDSGKKARVSSAEIELNGVDLVEEKDLNKKVETLQYDVQLAANNELEVEIESCKDCELEITVQGEKVLERPVRPVR